MLDVETNSILADLANYRARSGFFAKHFLWKSVDKVDPLAWWTGLCSFTELSKIASRILSLPLTTAACERTFSSYSSVLTKKRNRLTNDRSSKLVYIQHNLRLLNAKQPYQEKTDSDEDDVELMDNENENDADSEVESG